MDKEETQKITQINSLLYLKLIKFLVLVFFSFFILVCGNIGVVSAASLYFSPASGNYKVGDNFSVSIYVSSSEQAMNAVSGFISFSSDKLEITSLSKINTTISLWVQEPSFSNNAGTVNFEGIVYNPGYTGKAGRVVTINFKTKKEGSAGISFSSSSVLANDGQGTDILASSGSANFLIAQESKEKTTKEVAKDIGTYQTTIISPTHPDQNIWYNKKDARFQWDLPFGTTGVSILLNDKEISDPGPVSDGLFSSKEYLDLDDGISYIHIKIQNKFGWGKINDFKIQIDTQPPKPFSIDSSSYSSSSLPLLKFKTQDELSGLDKYEVMIGNEKTVLKNNVENYEMPTIFQAGHYNIIIKAIDKAGNETLAFAELNIEASEPPKIVNYEKVISYLDKTFICGESTPYSDIEVYIQNVKTNNIIKKDIKSNANGEWCLIYSDTLEGDNYSIWSISISPNGRKSTTSNKVNIKVEKNLTDKIGLDKFNILTFNIILFIINIAFIIYSLIWIVFIKKKIKEEVENIKILLEKNRKKSKKKNL